MKLEIISCAKKNNWDDTGGGEDDYGGVREACGDE